MLFKKDRILANPRLCQAIFGVGREEIKQFKDLGPLLGKVASFEVMCQHARKDGGRLVN
jgi:hypothetical protein